MKNKEESLIRCFLKLLLVILQKKEKNTKVQYIVQCEEGSGLWYYSFLFDFINDIVLYLVLFWAHNSW